MSPVLRVVLIVGAFIALWIVDDRVRKKKIRIADSVYWVVCAVLMLLLAVFPGIAFFFAGLLGFLSSSNFVFCMTIVLMLIKLSYGIAAITRPPAPPSAEGRTRAD